MPPMVAIVPIASKCSTAADCIYVPSGMGGLPDRGALLPRQLRFVDCSRLTAPIGGELSREIMDKLQDLLLRTL